MRSLRTYFRFALLSACAVLSLFACNDDTKKNCGPGDQRDSYMAPAVKFPITLLSDQFKPVERQAIQAAVEEWNRLGKRVVGKNFFHLVANGNPLPENVRVANPNDCTARDDGPLRVYLIDKKSAAEWSQMGFTPQVSGATIRCTDGAELVHQNVYVNTATSDPAQFGTVVLHELGHAIGLNHSCLEDVDRADYKGCAGVASGHPYWEAVMYPWLNNRGAGRYLLGGADTLRANDQERTQCLLSDD